MNNLKRRPGGGLGGAPNGLSSRLSKELSGGGRDDAWTDRRVSGCAFGEPERFRILGVTLCGSATSCASAPAETLPVCCSLVLNQELPQLDATIPGYAFGALSRAAAPNDLTPSPRHAPLPSPHLHPSRPHLLRAPQRWHPRPPSLAARQSHKQGKSDLGQLGKDAIRCAMVSRWLEALRHPPRQQGPATHTLPRMGPKDSARPQRRPEAKRTGWR